MREIEDASTVLHKLARMFEGHDATPRGTAHGALEAQEQTRAVIDRMPPGVQAAWDATQRALLSYHSARARAREYVDSFHSMAVTSLLQTSLAQEQEVASECRHACDGSAGHRCLSGGSSDPAVQLASVDWDSLRHSCDSRPAWSADTE